MFLKSPYTFHFLTYNKLPFNYKFLISNYVYWGQNWDAPKCFPALITRNHLLMIALNFARLFETVEEKAGSTSRITKTNDVRQSLSRSVEIAMSLIESGRTGCYRCLIIRPRLDPWRTPVKLTSRLLSHK